MRGRKQAGDRRNSVIGRPGRKPEYGRNDGSKPKKKWNFRRKLGYGGGRGESLIRLLGNIGGLELGGAQLDPDMAVGDIPAHLGFEGEHGSQQAQKNAHAEDLPMTVPLPHISSLPPER